MRTDIASGLTLAKSTKWAVFQEQQCLRKRGQQAYEEKLQKEEKLQRRQARQAAQGIFSAIDAERASLSGSESYSGAGTTHSGAGDESDQEVRRIVRERRRSTRPAWTTNGYNLNFNRDVFRPLEGYAKQRATIYEWETREPDEFRKAAMQLPQGIACSSTGSLSKRQDLRLSK
ncbi:unnamed protein product [Amoebophrya sp. A25]|nr:unnamed protein product [Amoebophrya sp. A25]|eukprot:GSA25T00017006001.1